MLYACTCILNFREWIRVVKRCARILEESSKELQYSIIRLLLKIILMVVGAILKQYLVLVVDDQISSEGQEQFPSTMQHLLGAF